MISVQLHVAGCNLKCSRIQPQFSLIDSFWYPSCRVLIYYTLHSRCFWWSPGTGASWLWLKHKELVLNKVFELTHTEFLIY